MVESLGCLPEGGLVHFPQGVWLPAQPSLCCCCCCCCAAQDPAAYTPGALELLQRASARPGLYTGPAGPYKMQRDRNMRVPWAGVSALLREVAAAWHRPEAWAAARAAGRQHFVLSANSTVLPAGGPVPAVLLGPP